MKYPKLLIKGQDYVKAKDPVYKYELLRNQYLQTEIYGYFFENEYIMLNMAGLLIGKKHYRYDGASGPTIDTASSMRGSLFHDIIWQLIEEGVLPESLRAYSNLLLRNILIEDGMWEVRAYLWYYSVDYVGRPFIRLKKRIYGRT